MCVKSTLVEGGSLERRDTATKNFASLLLRFRLPRSIFSPIWVLPSAYLLSLSSLLVSPIHAWLSRDPLHTTSLRVGWTPLPVGGPQHRPCWQQYRHLVVGSWWTFAVNDRHKRLSERKQSPRALRARLAAGSGLGKRSVCLVENTAMGLWDSDFGLYGGRLRSLLVAVSNENQAHS